MITKWHYYIIFQEPKHHHCLAMSYTHAQTLTIVTYMVIKVVIKIVIDYRQIQIKQIGSIRTQS